MLCNRGISDYNGTTTTTYKVPYGHTTGILLIHRKCYRNHSDNDKNNGSNIFLPHMQFQKVQKFLFKQRFQYISQSERCSAVHLVIYRTLRMKNSHTSTSITRNDCTLYRPCKAAFSSCAETALPRRCPKSYSHKHKWFKVIAKIRNSLDNGKNVSAFSKYILSHLYQ